MDQLTFDPEGSLGDLIIKLDSVFCFIIQDGVWQDQFLPGSICDELDLLIGRDLLAILEPRDLEVRMGQLTLQGHIVAFNGLGFLKRDGEGHLGFCKVKAM